MDDFDVLAFLVGIIKGVPTVSLGVVLAWLLVKAELSLKGKGMKRVVRLPILMVAGVLGTVVIVLLSYPYGLSFHRLVFSLMIPFVFYGYVQILRYQLRMGGDKPGSPTINKRWLTGGVIVVLLMFGCYPPNVGIALHSVLVLGIWVSYIASFNYVIFFSNSDGFHDGTKFSLIEIVEDVIYLGLGFLLLWYAYTSIHESNIDTFPISNEASSKLAYNMIDYGEYSFLA